MALERRRVIFSGRVQGVGFRATCRWLARGHEVAGYVRNLPDGRVELLTEGDSEEIDRLLDSIRCEMGGFIRGEHSEPEPTGDPPLGGFHVRF
ncbi:MAG: acylphosphatase [Isosphaeraceae bacterium]